MPEAERDLELGADFYESQSPGLGAYLTESLTSDIDELALFGGLMRNPVVSIVHFRSDFRS